MAVANLFHRLNCFSWNCVVKKNIPYIKEICYTLLIKFYYQFHMFTYYTSSLKWNICRYIRRFHHLQRFCGQFSKLNIKFYVSLLLIFFSVTMTLMHAWQKWTLPSRKYTEISATIWYAWLKVLETWSRRFCRDSTICACLPAGVLELSWRHCVNAKQKIKYILLQSVKKYERKNIL